MSRLRRLVLSDFFFFLSCRVVPTRRKLSDFEFATLARVRLERCKQHVFLLTAWVFLPDRWHAIIYTGTVHVPTETGSPIPPDRIILPADPRTKI
jgi:hypothetical protein